MGGVEGLELVRMEVGIFIGEGSCNLGEKLRELKLGDCRRGGEQGVDFVDIEGGISGVWVFVGIKEWAESVNRV